MPVRRQRSVLVNLGRSERVSLSIHEPFFVLWTGRPHKLALASPGRVKLCGSVRSFVAFDPGRYRKANLSWYFLHFRLPSTFDQRSLPPASLRERSAERPALYRSRGNLCFNRGNVHPHPRSVISGSQALGTSSVDLVDRHHRHNSQIGLFLPDICGARAFDLSPNGLARSDILRNGLAKIWNGACCTSPSRFGLLHAGDGLRALSFSHNYPGSVRVTRALPFCSTPRSCVSLEAG